ncbi:MAG: hypothetical protein GF365_02160 [Candidatus Buchananbacteria bacterium]|nr:hypothetical protein [Candidatus Buchananbacteria bacterium]
MRKNFQTFLIVLVSVMILYFLWKIIELGNQDLQAAIITVGIFIVMISVVFYSVFITPKKEKIRISKLKAAGLKIKTKFIGIEGREYNGHTGKYRYYIVKTQGIDPFSQQTKQYYSKHIYKQIESKDVPPEIEVYIDPQESKNYFMDLPFLNI